MEELAASLYHVKQSIHQVTMLSMDIFSSLIDRPGIGQHLISVKEAVDVLLVHANQTITDAISLMMPSSLTINRTVKGFAASIIARAILRRMIARITLLKVIKLLLVLIFMAVSPAPMSRPDSKKSSSSMAPIDDSDSSSDDEDDSKERKSHRAKRRHPAAPNQSLLMAAITEAPELGKELLTLGRTYWRLTTRIASLIRTILSILRQHSQNWAEVTKLVVRLANLVDSRSNNTTTANGGNASLSTPSRNNNSNISSRKSPASMLPTSTVPAASSPTDTMLTRLADNLLRFDSSSSSSSSRLPAATMQSQQQQRRGGGDMMDIASSSSSRPPFTTLRSSL